MAKSNNKSSTSTKPNKAAAQKSATQKASTKKDSSRKPSQTAQILERIDLLMAMYEDGPSSVSQNEKATQNIDGGVTEKAISELLKNQSSEIDATFELLVEQVAEIDSKFDERFKSIDERIDQVSKRPETEGTPSESIETFKSEFEEQFKSLGNRLSKVTDEIKRQGKTFADAQKKTQGKQSNSKQNSDSTELAKQVKQLKTDLEEHLELATLQLEEKTKSFADSIVAKFESKGGSQSEDAQSLSKDFQAELEQQIGQQLESKLQEHLELTTLQFEEKTKSLTDSIDKKLKSLGKSKSKDQTQGGNAQQLSDDFQAELAEQLNKQLETKLQEHLELTTLQLEEKTKSLTDSIDKKLESQDGTNGTSQVIPEDFRTELETQLDQQLESKLGKHLESRFAELDGQISKITEAVTSQQMLIEANQGSGMSQQLEEKIESIQACLTQITGQEITDDSDSDQETEPEADSSEIGKHWHEQKKAMLSKYGIDPDYRPAIDSPTKETDSTSVPVLRDDNQEKLEDFQDSIENMSEADAESINNLKEELTSKLRDAEIELSINRAKLSQFKAQLEEKQVELDRRSAALESKLSNKKSDVKISFISRIKNLFKQQPDDRR